VAAELKRATSDLLEQGDFFVSGAATNDPHSHCFRHPIIQTAKKLNY